MARAISTATISFGLVSIPCKVYAASKADKISFKTVTKNGNTVKQQYVDAVTGEVHERGEGSKGYEYTKGKMVTFSTDELKEMESASDNSMEIVEFVPAEEIDSVHIEKSYFLGTAGNDKAYALLSRIMEDEWVVAIAKWKARGREHLVAIRPYQEGEAKGLVLQQLFYANERRSFAEHGVTDVEVSEKELQLASQFVDQLRNMEGFQPRKYKDEYMCRVKTAIDQKVAGKCVNLPAPTKKDTSLDLFEALQQSLSVAKKKIAG